MYRRLIPLLALAALTLSMGSCKKDRQDGVPLVGVDIEVNVTLPSYLALMTPGGWAYLTGGSNGILVYRNIDDFVAYDRHCPHRPEDLCRVHMEDSGIILADTTCCHSRFSVLDGSLLEGPARRGLQRYNTTFNGTVLRIYN